MNGKDVAELNGEKLYYERYYPNGMLSIKRHTIFKGKTLNYMSECYTEKYDHKGLEKEFSLK